MPFWGMVMAGSVAEPGVVAAVTVTAVGVGVGVGVGASVAVLSALEEVMMGSAGAADGVATDFESGFTGLPLGFLVGMQVVSQSGCGFVVVEVKAELILS